MDTPYVAFDDDEDGVTWRLQKRQWLDFWGRSSNSWRIRKKHREREGKKSKGFLPWVLVLNYEYLFNSVIVKSEFQYLNMNGP